MIYEAIDRWNSPDSYLEHFGVKGMKWGVRKYRPSSIRGAIAAYRNRKVDKSFNKWKKNSELRDTAISKGKAANEARVAYETNKSKETKAAYKAANKDYKKALRKNTTYRKGQIRGEVGQDMSKKYLSLAKRTGEQKYVDKYNIERDRARRAPDVGAARSRRIAAFKRGMTIAVKTAVVGAAVGAGVAYAKKKGMININSEQAMYAIKRGARFMRYVYF